MKFHFRRAQNILDNYPQDWPPKEYFVDPRHVTKAQMHKLEELINDEADETEIDVFLRQHLPILALCLSFFSTGHHGTWIIPQQSIRPNLNHREQGLKPDYLIGGKSSDGFTWWVLELKGVNENIFANSNGKICFTQTANRGVFQLLEYIDYCSEAQSFMREVLGLKRFREPKGILLIGRDAEMVQDPRRERLKSAWNRANRALQVRTYSALLRAVQNNIEI